MFTNEQIKLNMTGVLVVILALAAVAAAQNNPPVVSNVNASQRDDDSKLVDIYYDLADADGDTCTVWVAVSADAGVTWSVPVFTLIGSYGNNITPGTGKHIIWDAGADIPGKVGNLKVRVFADDGKDQNIEMVFVPAGIFHYQNSDWIQIESYFISKYEITNQQYCEFLNNADPDGIHYGSHINPIYNDINQYGEAGNYSYSVVPGKENYPVRYVNSYDAAAFATWQSSQTGLTYRLPTEQEWEKAAGWDPVLQKLWTYGFQQDTIDCNWCNYDLCMGDLTDVGYYNGINPNTNDAKSYYGCYDMSGNIQEWTSSIYYPGSYQVVRGGLFYLDETWCAVTYRQYFLPNARHNIGFRVVLDFN